MKKRNIRQLLLSIIACQVAGFVGAAFTFSAIPVWYAGLTKPSFNPPNWIFGPVWTTLYILMGIALSMVWKKKWVRNLFLVHLVVNTAWSIIFFGLHSILGGMVTIIILWGFIVTLVREFYKVNKQASYLLLPYLAWVSFASILNFSLLVLNPSL